jgi:hypothetical protein
VVADVFGRPARSAGTMVVNGRHDGLRPPARPDEWKITIVDQHETHYYQPGFLFIPFGMYSKSDVVKPKRDFIPGGVELIMSPIEVIEPEHNRVKLAKDGRYLDYDFLVIATGARTHPEETPGLEEHEWYKSIYDFYTIEGALALARTCAIGKAAAWSSTWSKTRSSARSRRSSSSCWPTGSSTSRASATGSNWSTPPRCPAHSPSPSLPSTSATSSMRRASRWSPSLW